MKIKCPGFLIDGTPCESENLDQGVNSRILCHDCGTYSIITRALPGRKAEIPDKIL